MLKEGKVVEVDRILEVRLPKRSVMRGPIEAVKKRIQEAKQPVNGFFSGIFEKRNRPYLILAFTYLLLAINMILCEKKAYSVEWAFVGFIIVALLYALLEIDSRFLIFPAILLIGYCPFLLMGKLSAFAESMAIYAYYLLVVGVVLQFIEQLRKKEPLLDFGQVAKKVAMANPFKGPNITLLAVVAVVAWLGATRPEFNGFVKYTALYLLVLVSVLNGICMLYQKESHLGSAVVG